MSALRCRICQRLTTSHEARQRKFNSNRCTCGGTLVKETQPVLFRKKKKPGGLEQQLEVGTSGGRSPFRPSLLRPMPFAFFKYDKEDPNGDRQEADRDRDQAGEGTDCDSGARAPEDTPACEGGAGTGVVPLLGWKTLGIRIESDCYGVEIISQRFRLFSPVISNGDNPQMIWPTKARFEALCAYGSHSAPCPMCGCGIYSSTEPPKAMSYAVTGSVFAECFFWGRCEIYEYGMRAQFAYPKRLFVLAPVNWVSFSGSNVITEKVAQTTAKEAAEGLAKAYGVPAEIRDYQGMHRWAFSKSPLDEGWLEP